MGIAFMDLKTQYGRLETKIRERIDGVLAHGRYVNGPEVAELEQALADYTGAKRVIGCSSGTDALLMPLMACGVGPGDAVFTTPFSFIATAEVVALIGATPVFVDIDPDTFNLDPNLLADAILRVKREGKLRPRMIIPVDLFGLPADYEAINDIACKHDLLVLEDAAQSIGGRYKDRMAGNLGYIGATSFYPAKPLGCYGDGGAIFTNDDRMADILRSIREHGQGENRYDNVRVGINGRLDSLQAAVLLAKLTEFEKEIEMRNQVAAWYDAKLTGVVKPRIPDGYRSAWALYTVRSERREAARAALQEAGVPTVVYYPKPLHLQPAFAHYGGRQGDFPHAEKASRQVFSLPMHPFLTEAEVDQAAEALKKALANA